MNSTMSPRTTASTIKSIIARRIEEEELRHAMVVAASKLASKRYAQQNQAVQHMSSKGISTKFSEPCIRRSFINRKRLPEHQDVFHSTPQPQIKKQRTVTPVSDSTATSPTKVVKIPPGAVGLTSYTDTDVLSGRGGGTNTHSGNRFFRGLIDKYREQYLRAKKNDKPAISRNIVNCIRSKEGRFLKKDEKTGLWFEIGDDQAREKTSQALRQRAPDYRRKMEEQDQLVIESARMMTHSSNASPQTYTSTSQYPSSRRSHLLEQLLSIKEEQLKIQQQMLMVHEARASLGMNRLRFERRA